MGPNISSAILMVYGGRQPPPGITKALFGMGLRFVRASPSNLGRALCNESPQAVVVYFENFKNEALKIFDVIKNFDDNLPVIATSKSSSLEDAVAAMKAGAYDYFHLPPDRDKFKHVIENAVRLYSLTKRVFLLESRIGLQDGLDDIIGETPVMRELFNTIRMVAKSNATVLISGESGTGKELVAKAIHRHSTRCHKAFLDINCGAIPRNLLENEMFGHEKGSYTGADRKYIGSLESADGGTIFLDEISEMEPKLQVKLLRFLQSRSFMRVGGREEVSVDVRIVAATNRDLAELIGQGAFREDLYYRLNVVPVVLPPLRDKRDDIPLLAKYFLRKIASKNEKIFIDFAPQAMEALLSYDWPGNVRELQNVIEQIVVMHNDTKVKIFHLPLAVCKAAKKALSSSVSPRLDDRGIIPLNLVEKYAIESALRLCMGNIAEAAKKLKVGKATLYRKIKNI